MNSQIWDLETSFWNLKKEEHLISILLTEKPWRKWDANSENKINIVEIGSRTQSCKSQKKPHNQWLNKSLRKKLNRELKTWASKNLKFKSQTHLRFEKRERFWMRWNKYLVKKDKDNFSISLNKITILAKKRSLKNGSTPSSKINRNDLNETSIW